MRTFIRILLLSSTVAVGILAAQNAPTIKKVPVSATSAASGQEMFLTYCAVCHGKDGKGGGPAAVALKQAPTNLTTLSAHNKGKFPDMEVAQTISGNTVVAAHGSRDMPIWSDLFMSLNPGSPDMTRLRIGNLTDYVKSIQTK